jgi:predicted Zn finger-like uncharacterized protein
MAISVQCPSCRQAYRLNEQFAGRLVRCRQCGAAIQASALPQSFDAASSTYAAEFVHPAEATYPAMANYAAGHADFGGGYQAPSRPAAWRSPAARKSGYGPIVWIALAGGSLVGLAVVGVMIAASAIGEADWSAFAPAPKRERNKIRPITAPAKLPARALPAAPPGPPPPYTGPSPEPILQQILAASQRINGALAAIHDEASARQHQQTIVAELRKVGELIRDGRLNFPDLPAAEAKRLNSIYEPQIKASGEQSKREAERISRIPDAARVLAHSLRFEDLRFRLDLSLGASRARRSSVRRTAHNHFASLTGPGQLDSPDPFAQFAEREVVEIVIQKLPGDVSHFISERIKEISNCKMYMSKGEGGSTLRVTIAPISDVRELAAKIDFGKVTKIDASQSLFVVVADPSKLPTPLPPEASDSSDPNYYRRSLEDLSSRDLSRRRSVAMRLMNEEPKELRTEIARAFVALLKDPDALIRRLAAAALPTWGTADQAVPPLIEALGDSDQGVVDCAIQALGKLKDLRAVGPICEKATRYGFQVHEALRSIGPAAEGEVLKYLNHSDENVRRTAVLALADIGTAQCLPLLEQVSHRGDSTRGEAERALQMVRERISKNGT